MNRQAYLITQEDIQRLPEPPRRLPWIVAWYLYFQCRGMHCVYGIITLIFVFGLPELPHAVSILIPWHALHQTAPARIVSIDETPLYGSDDEVDTDWIAPTGYLTTYHYSFVGTGSFVYAGTTRALGQHQYAMGEVVTVRYLPYFPFLSHIDDVNVSYNGHEFFFGLAMPFLAIIILISVFLVHRKILRFYRWGRITSAHFHELLSIPKKQCEDGEPKTLLSYRFLADDQREYTASTEGRKRKPYGDNALVVYLPKRPAENMLIPKKWKISALALDEQGQIRPLAGRWCYVVLLPSIYVSLLVFVLFGIDWVLFTCLPLMLFLWFALRREEYVIQ